MNEEAQLIQALQQAEVSESQLLPQKKERNELQRTKEWFIDRLGMITGTDAETILSGIKTDKIQQFIYGKIAEKLYDTTNDLFMLQMSALQWGNMFEQEAIEYYEKLTGSKIKSAKFYRNKSIKGSGSSVDGYVGSKGLVEIKCPYNSANHVSILLGNDIDAKYYKQIQKQLFDTGRLWCDYVSYDPRMLYKYKMKIVRVYPDAEMHQKFTNQIALITNEIEINLNFIKS